jgi:hypothetical protein
MRRVLALALLLWIVLSCARPRPDLEDFVVRYVTSVVTATPFHERYTPPEERGYLTILRSKVTADFEVTSSDYLGPGDYSFGVTFSNGASVVVEVRERGDSIETVSIAISDQPSR